MVVIAAYFCLASPKLSSGRHSQDTVTISVLRPVYQPEEIKSYSRTGAVHWSHIRLYSLLGIPNSTMRICDHYPDPANKISKGHHLSHIQRLLGLMAATMVVIVFARLHMRVQL